MGGRGLSCVVHLCASRLAHSLCRPTQRATFAGMATPPGALTAALDALWDAVREEHPALPPARVTVSPRRVSTNHGADRWRLLSDGYLSGLVIDADTLRNGPTAALTGILHEAAHVACWRDGQQDTATRGRYHNGVYLEAAIRLGMVWAADGPAQGVGYASPVPTPETVGRYDSALTRLAPAIEGALPYLDGQPTRRSTTPARVSIACGCSPPRLGRMSQTVLDRGPIICGVCGQEFTPAAD